MNEQFHLLVVGPDEGLQEECASAASSSKELRPVIHYATEVRQAVEMARNRQPNLAIIEMQHDLNALKILTDEINVVSPGTVVLGAFRRELVANMSDGTFLMDALRLGIRDFLRRPISTVDFSETVVRLLHKLPQRAGQLGKVVTFASNKGGVGKSTLAVNTAFGLAAEFPDRVLLIDASLQTGVCATMLDLDPQFTLVDAVRQRDRLDELLIQQLATVHPAGLHLLAAPNDAFEGAQVDDEIFCRILALARRAYDYVIVDTFPVFDQVIMALLDLSDRTYIVLDNALPCILGGVKFLELLNKVGYPVAKQRLVLNRYTKRGGNLSAADVALRLGRPVRHIVPFDRSFVAAANLGQPLVGRARWWQTSARRLHQIIKDIETMECASLPTNGHPKEPGGNGVILDQAPKAPTLAFGEVRDA